MVPTRGAYRLFSHNTFFTPPAHSNKKTGNGKARGAKGGEEYAICKEVGVFIVEVYYASI
jgi:hypothetical protein